VPKANAATSVGAIAMADRPERRHKPTIRPAAAPAMSPPRWPPRATNGKKLKPRLIRISTLVKNTFSPACICSMASAPISANTAPLTPPTCTLDSITTAPNEPPMTPALKSVANVMAPSERSRIRPSDHNANMFAAR
jgi:hypothetical protein